jgi:hypothetical protein
MRPKALLPALLVALTAARVSAQSIEDSVMMRKNSLCTAVVYSNDRWESYWEGPLKRENGNIGRITTQSVSGMVDYGVTDRLNVIAGLPYVWTKASQGVLHGASGWQDLTVAAKFNLLETEFPAYTSGHSTFSAAAAVVLSYLFPSAASSFDAMKEEAAISRLYGAIHYRSDIEVGKDHGKRIGGYTVSFARQDGAN